MIVIAVAASLVAYAWVMGYLGFTTAKVGKAIQIQSIDRDAGVVTVWVQNVGDSPVTLSNVYADGLLKTIAPGNYKIEGVSATLGITPLPQGDTASIVLPGTFTDDQVTVKVVNIDGSFIEYTETFVT